MRVRLPGPLRHLVGVAVLVTAAQPCFADLRAQVAPVRDAITVRPGVPATREIVIANGGSNPVVVHVRLSDWTLDERGEMQLLPAGTLPSTLSGCLRFEPETFSLQAGESGRILVTLALSDDGLPTRWGVLLSEVRPVVASPVGMGPRAVAELGTTLYLSRVPPERIAPELTALQVRPAGRDSLSIRVTVRNAGEGQFHVTGELAVADSSRTPIHTSAPFSGVVLPGRDREFTWMCEAPSLAGTWFAVATLDTGTPELLVGEARLHWPPEPPPAPLATRP